MADQAKLRIKIDTPFGPIAGDIGVDTGPMRLPQLVPMAQSLASEIIRRALRKDEADGHRLSCRAGCGACCRQLVPISAPEALLLRELVDSMPEERRDVIEKRFDDARAYFRETDLGPALAGELAELAADVARFNAVAGAYFTHGIACPFLEDENCTIHQFRPIACRDYNVTTPAELCLNPLTDKIRRVPAPRWLAPALSAVASKLTGEPEVMIPLSLALGWADEHRELGQRTWPGMDLFKALIEEIGRL